MVGRTDQSSFWTGKVRKQGDAIFERQREPSELGPRQARMRGAT